MSEREPGTARATVKESGGKRRERFYARVRQTAEKGGKVVGRIAAIVRELCEPLDVIKFPETEARVTTRKARVVFDSSNDHYHFRPSGAHDPRIRERLEQWRAEAAADEADRADESDELMPSAVVTRR